jgi:hypothetical protein
MAVDSCRFDGGSIAGTPSSPVTLVNSFANGLSMGTNVSASGAAPVAQLGSTWVRRQQMPLGQTVDLDHDLPAGFLGVWIWGLGVDQPSLQSGLRLYIDPNTLFVLPGVWRAQGRVPFFVPPIRALRDRDLVFQMVVGHDVGVRGPMMQAPPGGRLILR